MNSLKEKSLIKNLIQINKMNRFNGIVESEFAPSKKDMWLYKGTLKYFGPSGWSNVNSENQNNVLYWDNIVDLPQKLQDKDNIILNNTYTNGTKVGVEGKVNSTGNSWGLYSYVDTNKDACIEIGIGGNNPTPLYVRRYKGDARTSSPQDATSVVTLLDPTNSSRFPGKVFSYGDKLLVNEEDPRLMSTADKQMIDWHIGFNQVSSLQNLPVNKRMIRCSLTQSSPQISFESLPQEGQEFIIYIHNASDSQIVQSIDLGSGNVYFNGTSITLAASKQAKVVIQHLYKGVYYVNNIVQ